MATRIFSGIQPTGAKHLGNYSGGFRQYVATQEQGDALFCIVDLHSVSVAYSPDELRETTLDLAAMMIATGLDAERSTLFVQSHVTAHAEAAWLLGSVATMGELRRMTQFKEKSAGQESVSVDLFTYPVLMAGDILLYQTDAVPVGEDQRQHLELARDLAERFNGRYGPTFRVPAAIIPPAGARIMDLQDPLRKMSTSSASELGKILMLDGPDTVRRKLRAAVTDTGREVRRSPDKPGVTNLVDIMTVATGRSAEDIEAEFGDGGYGPFKAAVTDAVVELLTPIQALYAGLRSDPAELQLLLGAGAERATALAAPTLAAMYEAMGFVPR